MAKHIHRISDADEMAWQTFLHATPEEREAMNRPVGPNPEPIGDTDQEMMAREDGYVRSDYEHKGVGETVDAGGYNWINDMAKLILEHPEMHPLLVAQHAVAMVTLEDIEDPEVLKTALSNAVDLIARITNTLEEYGLSSDELGDLMDAAIDPHVIAEAERYKDREIDD